MVQQGGFIVSQIQNPLQLTKPGFVPSTRVHQSEDEDSGRTWMTQQVSRARHKTEKVK